MRKIWGALAALALAGCVSSQEVADRTGARYGNRHIDEVVRELGPPQSQYTLSNGDRLLTWQIGDRTYNLPGRTSANRIGDTIYVRHTPGGSFDIFCVVEFTAGTDGLVKAVRIRQDTIGRWTTSRCHEMLR